MAKKQQDKKEVSITTPKTTETKPKAKHQSNLALGRDLFARKATEKEVFLAFTKAYAAAGKTDPEFIKRRAAVYMRIAANSAV